MRRDRTPREVSILASLDDRFLPRVLEALAQVTALAATASWHPVVVSGRRSAVEQMRLYQHGRELREGGWVRVGKTVTNALPEQTPHTYGLAVDVALLEDTNGEWLGFDHGVPGDVWTRVGEIVESCGLIWGGRWIRLRDGPHWEMPAWRDMRPRAAPDGIL